MSFSFEAFGPVAYPLLMCSFVSLMLIIERIMFFALWKPGNNEQAILNYVRSLNQSAAPSPSISNALLGQNQLAKGTMLLLHHAQKPRELREEIINHWLESERNSLTKHFGWFILMSLISPMLGLLGTVLGIIKVFSSIASHTGPVHPALLADGLGQAMLTTAAGLTITLPVLLALHGLRIWANSRLSTLAEALNAINLLLEGIDLQLASVTAPKANNKLSEVTLA